ncbi:MAG: hypothetical protein JW817_06230 [Clostridiales bacterium]|nr:hypothetical protein [Clostridiales bacterium]
MILEELVQDWNVIWNLTDLSGNILDDLSVYSFETGEFLFDVRVEDAYFNPPSCSWKEVLMSDFPTSAGSGY